MARRRDRSIVGKSTKYTEEVTDCVPMDELVEGQWYTCLAHSVYMVLWNGVRFEGFIVNHGQRALIEADHLEIGGTIQPLGRIVPTKAFTHIFNQMKKGLGYKGCIDNLDPSNMLDKGVCK
jgi:hypothetical protein